MLELDKIKGIIFDYGGTLDSNGKHWAEVLWDAYEKSNIPVDKKTFRDAYVYGERYLALHPVIKPHHTFKDLLLVKTILQVKWLIENGFLPDNAKTSAYSLAVSNQCYNFAISTLQKARPIIEKLSEKYPLVLVSNFYGNVESVLIDFNFKQYFDVIVESALVGVRKPDPAIFSLGVDALKLSPQEVVVIGDSYTKDIVPASLIGCKTVWIKGIGWEEEKDITAVDVIISDFTELEGIFKLR